jgi:Arc/MetJ family transcription regulator
MRATLDLDDGLLAEAMRLTRSRTKGEAVERALREMVARHAQRALRDLVGRDLLDPGYDVRTVRAGTDSDTR